MFYDKLKKLCNEKNTNVTRLISELGLSSGNLSGWKKGAIPKSNTLEKISDYFGVSTDYLLGKENEDISLSKIDPEILKMLENPNQDLKLLLKKYSQLTDENKKLLLDVADLHFNYQNKKE